MNPKWLLMGVGAALVASLAVAASPQHASAAMCTSNGNGNWDSTGTWDDACNSGGIPQTGDTVVIATSVTLNQDASLAGLTINSGGTLTESGAGTYGITLTSGDWTNNGGTFAPGDGTVTFSSTTAAQAINGTAATQTFNNITINKGGWLLSVAGSTTTLDVNGGLTPSAGSFSAGTASVIYIAGNCTGGGAFAFTAGNGAVIYDGAGAQTVCGWTYNNLTISTSYSTATLGGAVIVNSNLAIYGGTLDTSASNYAVTLNGSFIKSGTFTANASPITIGGTVGYPSIAAFSTTRALSFTRTAVRLR